MDILSKGESDMKYTLNCDIMDGLVFIDESYLSELNDELDRKSTRLNSSHIR